MSAVAPRIVTSSDPTLRQRQSLELISKGKQDKEIGAVYGITAHGARHRSRRLLIRLGADNRAHAVRIGFERALLLPSNPEPLAHKLSSRERHVLDLISCGYTNEQVARYFYLTVAYLKQILTTVYRKLGAENRPHAVRLGFEHGLLITRQYGSDRGGDRG